MSAFTADPGTGGVPTRRLPPVASVSDTDTLANIGGSVGCRTDDRNHQVVMNDFFRKIMKYLSETGGCFVSGAFMIEDPKSQIVHALNRCKPLTERLRGAHAVTHSYFKPSWFWNRSSNSSSYPPELKQHFTGNPSNFRRVFHPQFETTVGSRMVEFNMDETTTTPRLAFDVDLVCELIYRSRDGGGLRRYQETFQKQTLNFYPVHIVDENPQRPERTYNPGDRVMFLKRTTKFFMTTPEERFGTVNSVRRESGRDVILIIDDVSNREETVSVNDVKPLYEFLYAKLETTSSTSAEHAANITNKTMGASVLKSNVFLPTRPEDKHLSTSFTDLAMHDLSSISLSGNMMTPRETARAEEMTKFYNHFIRANDERFIPAVLLWNIMKGPNMWHNRTDPRTVHWESIEPGPKPGEGDEVIKSRSVLLDLTNTPSTGAGAGGAAMFGRHKRKRNMISLRSFVKKYPGSARKAIQKYKLAMQMF